MAKPKPLHGHYTAIIVRDRYSWKRSSPLLHHAIDVLTQQLRRWKWQ
jgi:hypothetical protein